MFSSSLLLKTFLVWLHVRVPPQHTAILNYAVRLLPDKSSRRANLCRLWPAASATKQPRLLPSALFLCSSLSLKLEIELDYADVLLLSSS